MIEQLKTIQTGLAIAIDAEGFVDKPVRRALLDAVKAAAQLEAMVGEQEPVAWQGAHDPTDLYFTKPPQADVHPLYRAAPVAPQPTFDARRALEAIEALLSNIRRDAPSLSGKVMGFAEEVAAALRDKVAQQPPPCESPCGNVKCAVGCKNYVVQQPQAEDTIKRQAQKIAELTADRDGWIEAHARLHREYHDFRKAAPQQVEAVPKPTDTERAYLIGFADGKQAQQAEAVPPDVVRDAERLNWIINNARITSEHWGGRWSIVLEGKAPDSLEVFSVNPQTAVRRAIDSAIAQQIFSMVGLEGASHE